MRAPGEAASLGGDWGPPSPSTWPQPAQATCSIPRYLFFLPIHVDILFVPVHCFPEHPDEGKRGEKAGAAQDLLIPGEISPLLTLGWGRMSGGLRAASPPILGTRHLCDRGVQGVSQGDKAGIATQGIYFCPKPLCEPAPPSPALLGPQHIIGDSFAEPLSSRLSS